MKRVISNKIHKKSRVLTFYDCLRFYFIFTPFFLSNTQYPPHCKRINLPFLKLITILSAFRQPPFSSITIGTVNLNENICIRPGAPLLSSVNLYIV